MTERAKWTWLVYMAGDNNLEGAGRADLVEMKAVGSTDKVNVIVQFDTEKDVSTRYRVEKNKLRVLEKSRGKNMGDPKVLTDFLKWGVKSYPAERYLVDIWNHGGGWENLPDDYDYDGIRSAQPMRIAKLRRARRTIFRSTAKAIARRPAESRAIAIDVGSQDYLDNQELRKAVAKALPGGRKFDILGCDACLMNMVEIAYEMRDTAGLMVGSEETEPGAGWPYKAILARLVKQPAMAPADLAELIVEEYGKYFARTHTSSTQSALDLARVGAVKTAVDALAQALLHGLPANEGAISLARDWVQKFEYPEYVDLGDLAAELIRNLPADAAVQKAARKVQDALGDFVIANKTVGAKMARAGGASIYLPPRGELAPDYADLLFSRESPWKSLLAALNRRGVDRVVDRVSPALSPAGVT